MLASVDETVLIKSGVDFNQFNIRKLFLEQTRINSRIDHHDRCPHAVSLIQRSKQKA